MEHIDDDFGDLYADVEVQASSAINGVPGISQLCTEEDDIDEEANGTGLNRVDSTGDDDADKVSNPEANGEKEVTVDNESDSEDDLNILLNNDDDDDDGPNFPATCGGGFEHEEEVEEENGGLVVGLEGSGSDKNRKCIDHSQVGDGLEQSLNVVGGGGDRGNGGKGSYRSQYKYIRPHPAAFASTSKGNGFAGIGSYSSTSDRGEEDIGCNQLMRSSSLVAQRRHGFSLPRSRTILDVNIDTFERKPWRHPEADITDFFNFGFDEDSWKRYCNHLDQCRHGEFMSTRILASESFKANEAYEAGSEHETVAQEAVAEIIQSRRGRIVSPTSKIPFREQKHSEMQKGRAIQVEDSISERQPSMDIRRPLHRDSDVIQINVQDSKEDSSGLVKDGLDAIDNSEYKASENGDFDVDDGRENLCFSSASEDEPQKEHPDGHRGGLDISVSKRCSQQATACERFSMGSDNHGSAQISDLDGHRHQEVAFCDSEGTAETIETSKNTKEKVGRNTCNRAPSICGKESSQGKHSQRRPSPSCSGTHCAASRDGAYADTEKYRNHIKRTSPNSVTELRESVTSDYFRSKDSRSHGKTRLGDCKYYARHRSPIRENLNHNDRRLHGRYRLKTHFDNEDASRISDSERLDDVHHSAVGHSRQNERLRGFDSHHGEDMSYCKESELSFSYYGERFSDYHAGSACTKNRHRKGHQSIGVDTDRSLCRNSDEEEFLLEQRISRMDDEVMDRDWHHYEGLRVEDTDPLTCRESKQLDLKYSSNLDHEREARWKRKGGESQCRKRMKSGDFFPEKTYTSDFTREKYERSVPYNYRDSDYIEHTYEEHLPYTRREVKSPGRSKRRYGSPSIDFDNLWYVDEEDEFWRSRDHLSLSSHSYKEPHTANSSRWQGNTSPRNDVYERHGRHGKYRREIWTERSRDKGSFGGYTDAFDTEESINNPDDRVYFGTRRHYWQSELFHWTEDESISRHDKFHAEAASFSFEKTSRRKRFDAELVSDHVGKLIDDRQVERHRFKLIRGGNSGGFDRSSNIIHRGNQEQTLQRCWDSVDSHFVVGEGKSSGRYPTARSGMYSGRHEKVDGNIHLEQKTSNDFNECYTEKVAQSDDPKVETNENDEKWLDKFPVTQHKEALDIEEGQIITEEINESTMENICASDDVAQIIDGKELRNRNATDEITAMEEHENSRILEVIAKMEKRRQRFKEPITLKKDLDMTTKPLVDSVDGTAEMNQQRPARKRRWGGS